MARSWMQRLVALVALFACLAASARGALQSEQGRLRAYLSTGVVRLGERAYIVISVDGAGEARVLGLPRVDGLEIGPLPQATVQQTLTSFNGRSRSSRELIWNVPVRPLRAGEYVIPTFSVEIDGQAVNSSPLALTAVQDLRGEELGFFEITRSSERVVEGQPFSIDLRFGWDAALDRRINMANLALPWWEALPGVLTMEPPPTRAGARTQTLGLNGNARVSVDEIEPQMVRGKPFRTFRLQRSFTPTRSGTLEFPPSFLEFGRRADGGVFAPRDNGESFFVQAAAFEVAVVPLPEDGRPLDYGGAIGSLVLSADAQPRDVDAGESIKFAVTVTGPGNLEFFTAPDPSRSQAFDGFRYFGKTESKSFERREIIYDLAPLSDEVSEIPALRLPVFDPLLGRYVELASEPIPIRVRELDGALALSGDTGSQRFERDVRDLQDAARGPRGAGRPGLVATLAALALGPALWLGLARVRRRRGDPNAPLERRRRRALRELERGLPRSSGPGQELDLLCRFLSSRSREPEAAWVGRPIADAQAELGLAPELARELDGLLGELERAAFAGAGERVGPERIVRLARRLTRGGL